MKYFLCSLMLVISNFVISQSTTNFIVVDQFGYLPKSEKIAVIRNPKVGFDSNLSFSPGNTYALVDVNSSNQVFIASPTIWNQGITDSTSGDQIWWFDFSSVETEGEYYVLDIDNNVKSFSFEIKPDVYNQILKEATRTFFYQRANFAKQQPFAEVGWVDGASHIGPLQDKNCRRFDAPNDVSTERDLTGGWYDAGDYNKYTNWTSNYIYEMLQTYEENPSIWTDDFNIPESNNGIPDILDEAKWGMDHLLRLQLDNGSMISTVGLSHSSPPSSATGQSLYGGVNTSSTLNASGTFAHGSKVYGDLGNTLYADSLKIAAIKAWDWAESNPAVIWENRNIPGGGRLAAGEQETNDYGRLVYKLRAAMRLFDLTGEVKYKTYFESNYTQLHLFQWNYAYPFEREEQEVLLDYIDVSNVTESVVNAIKAKYDLAMEKDYNYTRLDNPNFDPYLAYIKDYTWVSNKNKCDMGLMLFGHKNHDINSGRDEDVLKYGSRYIHYIHGVNPMNLVYLSNMYGYGGDNCVNQFYHTWFSEGSANWDEVGVSTYGPAPGFLVGGPNPKYNWDACCPNNCGSPANNAKCTAISVTPPKNQPKQKSYLDFNSSWPLNSWEVTENSNGYQISYIRLLANYVDDNNIATGTRENNHLDTFLNVFPNPSSSQFSINSSSAITKVEMINSIGQVINNWQFQNTNQVNLFCETKGVFILKIYNQNTIIGVKKIILN